jgi:hypothetical protein
MAGLYGRLQPRRRFGNRIRRGDADSVEAFRPGQLLDQAAQLLRVQKSSSG